jgi:putative thioredoxin
LQPARASLVLARSRPPARLACMSDASSNRNIVDTTEATFERDVIERSREVPVVVDFWATWCQPCRLLGPILERLADELDGKFTLVRAETEQVPNIAAQLDVRSIPAVFAIKDGRVADSFVGLLPESAIRAWVDRLLPTPAEQKAAEARRLETTDPHAAEAAYREAIALAPQSPAAKISLARLLLDQDRVADGQAVIAGLEARGFLEPEAERLKAELMLRAGADHAGDLAARRADVAAHPDDLGLRFKLAEAMAAAGEFAEALELALSIVEDGPKDLRESARKLMINLFQLLPGDSELAAEYRRKLSAALY